MDKQGAILNLKATFESIEIILDKADELLANYKCPEDVRRSIDVVIDEVCNNIASYAYSGETGHFLVNMSIGDKFAEFTICDNGMAFNPLEEERDIIPENLDNGGAGIVLAKELTDSIDYKRVGNENQLHFIKTWN